MFRLARSNGHAAHFAKTAVASRYNLLRNVSSRKRILSSSKPVAASAAVVKETDPFPIPPIMEGLALAVVGAAAVGYGYKWNKQHQTDEKRNAADLKPGYIPSRPKLARISDPSCVLQVVIINL